MSTALTNLRSRGYWVFVIRPTKFEKVREVNVTRLGQFVQANSVRMGGWHFPQYNPHSRPIIGVDYAEQSLEHGYHIEHWRLHQSGQFVFNRACFEDWGEHWPKADRQPVPKQGEELHVYPTLLLMVSACEFAARLALSNLGDARMVIETRLRATTGRRLLIRNMLRGELESDMRAGIDEIPITTEVTREDLAASPSETGVRMTQELFRRFNWDVQLSILRDIYNEMARYS